MTFTCGECGAEVTGRLVLVCQALGVPVFEDRCPGCRQDATFTVVEMTAVKTRRKAA